MRNKTLFILFMLLLLPCYGELSSPSEPGSPNESGLPSPQNSGEAGSSEVDNTTPQLVPGEAFVGQNLHITAGELISYQLSTGEHTLVQNGFSMSIGANQFSCDSAVIWVESVAIEYRSRVRVDYKITAYLQGNIQHRKSRGARTTDLSQTVLEQDQAMVVQFDVGGEIFVTANKRDIADPRELKLYKTAIKACQAAGIKANFIPELKIVKPKPPPPVPEEKEIEVAKPARPEEKVIRFRYPINIAPLGDVSPQVEWDEEKGIGTLIGRFYLWQKQDEKGGLLELQADNAVIFYTGQGSVTDQSSAQDILAKGDVSLIYLSGNVVMTEGQRIIRADELCYDFDRKKALAINAVMRNFDRRRGIPIYIRAAELKQLAENKFAAENITLTSSEFHTPQISLNASEVVITDRTSADTQEGGPPWQADNLYNIEMRKVRMKMHDRTVFYWPYMRANLRRPDIPLKSMQAGYDSDWGVSVETRWYLARLLGLRESEGTESTYALDYYGKRGLGTGAEIDYSKEDYFGTLIGYVIHDTGDDDLGRTSARRNLKPPRKLRGRFLWRHRHFLPYNWQLTTEISYSSDMNFIEQYYRSEFNVGKEQETVVHLKRIEDNWGLSFLGKARINDFVNKLEELPTAEFHWTGQSFFNDKLTFYSDSQVSRLRQRYASTSNMPSESFFTFAETRNEVDMPLTIGKTKVVPFVAGTLGYEDGWGFRTHLDGMRGNRENRVWFGEAGVRISPQSYWKVFPGVKSLKWDLNQLRHIVSPYMTAVGYLESDSVIEQRDMVNIGISQRLQTKRGNGENQRTVDWMQLDTEFTWVSDSGNTNSGPDRFIWNRSFIPLLNRYDVSPPQQDRRNSDIFGPRRNYFGADYIWRLSDTTALLSDMNYDVQSGVVQQFNIGFSHLRWPNFSYYIGSRYLRRFRNNMGEKGTNMVTFAATYVLDPRYTLVFSQQYDFDYGASSRSEIILIRRYHRMYWALAYSADESLKRNAIVFSLWPQGVPEMAFGPRKYMKLGGPADY
jgi:hypothetical protein